MSRPRRAFPTSRQRSWLNKSPEPLWVHLFDRRRKDGVELERTEEFNISFRITRVAVKVLGRAKLGGIHKNRDDCGVTLALGAADQAEMSFMQGPHRRNQAERFSCVTNLTRENFHVMNRGDQLHGKLSATGESSILSAGRQEQTSMC